MTDQQRLAAIRELNMETAGKFTLQAVLTAAAMTALAVAAPHLGTSVGDLTQYAAGTAGIVAGGGIARLLERAKKAKAITARPVLAPLDERSPQRAAGSGLSPGLGIDG